MQKEVQDSSREYRSFPPNGRSREARRWRGLTACMWRIILLLKEKQNFGTGAKLPRSYRLQVEENRLLKENQNLAKGASVTLPRSDRVEGGDGLLLKEKQNFGTGAKRDAAAVLPCGRGRGLLLPAPRHALRGTEEWIRAER